MGRATGSSFALEMALLDRDTSVSTWPFLSTVVVEVEPLGYLVVSVTVPSGLVTVVVVEPSGFVVTSVLSSSSLQESPPEEPPLAAGLMVVVQVSSASRTDAFILKPKSSLVEGSYVTRT